MSSLKDRFFKITLLNHKKKNFQSTFSNLFSWKLHFQNCFLKKTFLKFPPQKKKFFKLLPHKLIFLKNYFLKEDIF